MTSTSLGPRLSKRECCQNRSLDCSLATPDCKTPFKKRKIHSRAKSKVLPAIRSANLAPISLRQRAQSSSVAAIAACANTIDPARTDSSPGRAFGAHASITGIANSSSAAPKLTCPVPQLSSEEGAGTHARCSSAATAIWLAATVSKTSLCRAAIVAARRSAITRMRGTALHARTRAAASIPWIRKRASLSRRIDL